MMGLFKKWIPVYVSQENYSKIFEKYMVSYTIYQKGNEYKLEAEGYAAKQFPGYKEVFNIYRELQDGLKIVKGGKIYDK